MTGSKQPSHYVAVFLILEQDGKVLLQRRFNTGWMDGMYTLPSGHVEQGESVNTALIREAKEEIGISLERKNARLVHVMHRKSDEREYIDFFFEANEWDGGPANMEPAKCDQLLWSSVDTLPDETLPFVKSVVTSDRTGMRFTTLGYES